MKLAIGQIVTIYSVTGKAINLQIQSFKKIGTCQYANTIDDDGSECVFPVKYLNKFAK